jgi:hypothetical protein
MNTESTEFDLDIDAWSADWQSTEAEAEPATPLASIQSRVRRYTWSAAGSWLVGLTMVAGTTAMAWREREPSLIAAAVAVWVLVAVTAAIDLHYRRGTWRLAGETTRDYVELARRQLIARLRGIRYGWWLLGAETLFFMVWIPWVASTEPATRGAVMTRGFGLLAVLVVLFSIGLLVMRARADRELRGLERFRETMASQETTEAA